MPWYERYSTTQHRLRQLYRDPITNQTKWGVVIAPEGGIMGVHSSSSATPIKRANLDTPINHSKRRQNIPSGCLPIARKTSPRIHPDSILD